MCKLGKINDLGEVSAQFPEIEGVGGKRGEFLI
jgi:hypothetical protein